MRTALYLIFLLTAMAALAASMLSAEEEGLRHERFDVRVLVEVHRSQRGARLGAPAPMEYDNPNASQPPQPREFSPGDELADLVRRNVDGASWESIEGASVDWRGGWLHVRNRPATVKKVGEFLYQLTLEARRRMLISMEVSEGRSAGFPAQPEGASVASSGSVALPLGVERILTRTSRVQFVADYEVEIAQASNISNPIVVSAEQGLVASFAATPSIDGENVVIEALVQTAAYGKSRRLSLGVDEEYMPGPHRGDTRSHYGVLELPRYEHVQAHFTTVVPAAGRTISLPVAVRGRMTVLRLDARMSGPRGKASVIDLGTLVQAPMPVVFSKMVDGHVPDAWFAPRVRYLSKKRPGPCYGTSEDILDEVRSLVSPAYWESAGEIAILGQRLFHVRADDSRFAAVRAFLRDLERQAVRPVVVDLRIWSASGPVASGPVKAFPREGAQVVAAGILPTIVGRTASLMAGSTANYIADYDVEVAQEARIADPIVGQAFDGLVVNLRPTLSADAQTVDLALEMLLARRTLEEQPFETGAKFLGPIDHLRQDRSVVDTTVQVRVGGTYVIDLGVDPENKERRLAAEISVALP